MPRKAWQQTLRETWDGSVTRSVRSARNAVASHAASCGKNVTLAIQHLLDAKLNAPSMAAVRAAFLVPGSEYETSNRTLVAKLLVGYMLSRLNRKRERKGEPSVPIPPELAESCAKRNVVAELVHGVDEVSVNVGLVVLQLHNVESSDDPFSFAVKEWLEFFVSEDPAVASTPALKRDLFRTLLLVCRARSVDMLSFFKHNGLLSRPMDLMQFNMSYSGSLGDGSTSETFVDATPEQLALFAWSTLGPAGEELLNGIVSCGSAQPRQSGACGATSQGLATRDL